MSDERTVGSARAICRLILLIDLRELWGTDFRPERPASVKSMMGYTDNKDAPNRLKIQAFGPELFYSLSEDASIISGIGSSSLPTAYVSGRGGAAATDEWGKWVDSDDGRFLAGAGR